MANEAVKDAARSSGIYLWEVAQRLGIADTTLSRKLRRELTAAERERVFKAIEAIKSERESSRSAIRKYINVNFRKE